MIQKLIRLLRFDTIAGLMRGYKTPTVEMTEQEYHNMSREQDLGHFPTLDVLQLGGDFRDFDRAYISSAKHKGHYLFIDGLWHRVEFVEKSRSSKK